MDARKGNIFEILNGNKQFIIPVYQRYYSWGEEQCKRLWDDIVNMQKNGKPGHFVGSIVNIAEQAMPTGVQKYMIIDGQQRMTTLTLLLIALRNYVLMHPDDNSINAKRIDGMLLKNEYESGICHTYSCRGLKLCFSLYALCNQLDPFLLTEICEMFHKASLILI